MTSLSNSSVQDRLYELKPNAWNFSMSIEPLTGGSFSPCFNDFFRSYSFAAILEKNVLIFISCQRDLGNICVDIIDFYSKYWTINDFNFLLS